MVRLPIFPSPSTSRPALTNLRNSAETRLTSCKMNIQSWMARCRMPPEGRCRQHPPLPHCAFVCGVYRPRKPDAVALSGRAVTGSASLLSSSSSLPVPPLPSSAAFFRRRLRRAVLFSACLTCRLSSWGWDACLHTILLYIALQCRHLPAGLRGALQRLLQRCSRGPVLSGVSSRLSHAFAFDPRMRAESAASCRRC